jgi:hypothetical protein
LAPPPPSENTNPAPILANVPVLFNKPEENMLRMMKERKREDGSRRGEWKIKWPEISLVPRRLALIFSLFSFSSDACMALAAADWH